MLGRWHDKASLTEPPTVNTDGLIKPAYLIDAERRLAAARTAREGRAQACTKALREWTERPRANSVPPAVQRLQKDLAEADQEVKLARELLAAAREKFAPAFLSAIQSPVDRAVDELTLLANRAQAISDSLAKAQDFAARNGLTAAGVLSRAYCMREAARALQRTLIAG